MGNFKHSAACAIMMLWFTACSTTPVTTGRPSGTDGGPSSIPTAVFTRTITKTPTISPTPTVTSTPTITLTPTPPPDVELTNITIYPDTYNIVGQGYKLMARIRNNTNTTMVLYDTKKVFSFSIELWEYDQQMKYNQDPRFFHANYQFDVSAGAYRRLMNCILYPGEEGVAVVGFSSYGKLDEERKNYNGPLGVWYGYQSFYDTKPDLPQGFHY